MQARQILLVGGAGYIGSHMAKYLSNQGVEVVVLDNLSEGYADSVLSGKLIVGDLSDADLLLKIFQENSFDAVMHFASFIQVGESVISPDKYYQNNLVNTLNLINASRASGVDKFIFSSTAATFGEPLYTPIDERHPQNPINPYGRSKWMVEKILEDYDRAYGFKSVSLRYFNAAGADPSGLIGERHQPETHLIPLVLQVASGRRSSVSVFGNDYDTPDGTCIRDYIHVNDLCQAHWLALISLLNGQESQSYNLGNGAGFSVQQVIDVARKVTGRPIAVAYEARRPGDPARLIADSRAIRDRLGWQPMFAALEDIVTHAWVWEERLTQMPDLLKIRQN